MGQHHATAANAHMLRGTGNPGDEDLGGGACEVDAVVMFGEPYLK
ncbi:hypothetical protein [Pseudomonas helleri]